MKGTLRSIRAREHELAGLEARITSLEELEAARAEYGDAVRTVLAQANGKVGQQGAVADYLEVDAGYERAVEACLGDLLQHVIVERADQAAAGFQLLRDECAGRCGFLITSMSTLSPSDSSLTSAASGTSDWTGAEGLVCLSSVVRVSGPHAGAIRQAMGEAWIADSYNRAEATSRTTTLPVATAMGDLFRGPYLVTGGSRDQARGILETKRDIRELRGRIEVDRGALAELSKETAAFEAVMAQASNSIAALDAEHHRQEKAVVGYEATIARAIDEAARLAQKSEQLARERRQAEEERDALDRRQEEARLSITRLEGDQRSSDERLTIAQRRLFEAREAAEELSRRAADAGATHAALVERASALALEVQRLEEASAELETRAVALATDLRETGQRVAELRAGIIDGEARLDAGVRALETLRHDVQTSDDVVATLRATADEQEVVIKGARTALEAIRAAVAEFDIARARAESDLDHLAQACADAVQATLDDVLIEVAELERDGHAVPDARVICADEPDDTLDEDSARPRGRCRPHCSRAADAERRGRHRDLAR